MLATGGLQVVGFLWFSFSLPLSLSKEKGRCFETHPVLQENTPTHIHTLHDLLHKMRWIDKMQRTH